MDVSAGAGSARAPGIPAIHGHKTRRARASRVAVTASLPRGSGGSGGRVRSEAVFAADGNQIGTELQAILLGLVVVVVHPDAEVVAEVVADAGPCIPLVAAVIDAYRHYAIEIAALDVAAKQTCATAQVPVFGHVEGSGDAEVPAADFGLAACFGSVLRRDAAEVRVAAFDTEQNARRDGPAVAEIGAVSGIVVVIRALAQIRLTDAAVDEKSARIGGVAGGGNCGNARSGSVCMWLGGCAGWVLPRETLVCLRFESILTQVICRFKSGYRLRVKHMLRRI